MQMKKQKSYLIALAVMALSYPLIIDNLFLSTDINRVMLAIMMLPAVVVLMWVMSRAVEQTG